MKSSLIATFEMKKIEKIGRANTLRWMRPWLAKTSKEADVIGD